MKHKKRKIIVEPLTEEGKENALQGLYEEKNCYH